MVSNFPFDDSNERSVNCFFVCVLTVSLLKNWYPKTGSNVIEHMIFIPMERVKLISVKSRFRSNFYTGIFKLDWAKLKTALCTILYIALLSSPDNISAVRDTNGITCYENA